MAIYRLLGAAAALAVMTAPAMAQQVMGEPGYCAFFYPNANCQNKGPGNPYTGDAWLRLNQGGPMAASPQTGPHREEAPAPIPDIHAVTACPCLRTADCRSVFAATTTAACGCRRNPSPPVNASLTRLANVNSISAAVSKS